MEKQNRRKSILIENVEIIDTAIKGKSIAKHDGRVIFVQGGVPGDICDITVFKKKKKIWEARIEKVHTYSNRRTEPKCEHFGVCGGCKWQNMKYESQLDFKQNEVLNNLKRIGGIELPQHSEIIGSENEYFYRNKMEFTFSNKRWLTLEEIQSKVEFTDKDALGFHVPGMFDKVINLNTCHLQKDPSNAIRLSIKQFVDKNKLTYFDIRNQQGLLRNLMIRTTSTNDLMVLVQFFEANKTNITLVMEHIKKTFPEITSLLYIINQKANNTMYDQKVICFNGKDHIMQEMDGLYFKIGAKSFFQTNTEQAKVLYRKTKELAQITTNDLVYDLYTGTGTIAQYLAKSAAKVVGIDSVKEGIKAAYENAKRNNINNCTFYTGNMKDLFTDKFIAKNGTPDVIITDPPRDGMHKKVVEQILKIEAKRIVYVSCNSATQARDLALMDEKYKVTHIQPIDMFPQTHHVENIIVLELK
ncbi:MAG: 23S rRNA (uracil(1939)-C(5))-methyltransferase RlmD [Bacteroidota bacterium]|nr:23S rRNA (uracil(1939)-C(5))-methyltransferase RlmD [Bacteroidota bacterium]